MIPATSIYLNRAEGLSDDLEDVTLTGETLWQQADQTLTRWSRTVRGYSNKVDFTVTFADGETYSGTYDLKAGQIPTLAAHIINHLEFYGGLCQRLPTHLTPGQYQNLITAMKQEIVIGYQNFLKTYQIGELPTIEFWAINYRVLAPFPRWRGGVFVVELHTFERGIEYAVRTNDGRSLSKEGEWHIEPLTLTPEWLDEHRWQHIKLAHEAATLIAEKILKKTTACQA